MLLDISDLRVTFDMPDGSTVNAVNGLDLQLAENGSTAVIGESGSGKSVSMRAVLGLLPKNARVTGSAKLDLGSGDAIDLLQAGHQQLRRVRGREVGMVFQNAMESLNPSLTLARQRTDPLARPGHQAGGAQARREGAG